MRWSLTKLEMCRWLLLSLDRSSSNRLTMTQELIANNLGVRREGVTSSASKLQKLGVIEYCRGAITVTNRPKLEQLSCECYAVVKKETDRLLPFARPLPPPTIVRRNDLKRSSSWATAGSNAFAP